MKLDLVQGDTRLPVEITNFDGSDILDGMRHALQFTNPEAPRFFECDREARIKMDVDALKRRTFFLAPGASAPPDESSLDGVPIRMVGQ